MLPTASLSPYPQPHMGQPQHSPGMWMLTIPHHERRLLCCTKCVVAPHGIWLRSVSLLHMGSGCAGYPRQWDWADPQAVQATNPEMLLRVGGGSMRVACMQGHLLRGLVRF